MIVWQKRKDFSRQQKLQSLLKLIITMSSYIALLRFRCRTVDGALCGCSSARGERRLIYFTLGGDVVITHFKREHTLFREIHAEHCATSIQYGVRVQCYDEIFAFFAVLNS